MGWNDLSPKQQADWKKKNFNMKVNVSEAQLNKLRKEGTPTKAIAKYKNDPSMREALNRFYGKSRVDKAIGSTPVKPKAKPKQNAGPKPKVTPSPKPGPTPKPNKGIAESVKPKTNAPSKPSTVKGKKFVPVKGPQSLQDEMRKKKGPGGQLDKEKLLEAALFAAGFIPVVGVGARIGRTALMAKKAQTTYSSAKKILAAEKLASKGKPLAVGAVKEGGRRAKPLPKSLTKRVVAGTKNPKAYVKATGKRVASKTTRPTGRHVAPKATRPVGKHAAPKTGSKITRTKTKGRRVSK